MIKKIRITVYLGMLFICFCCFIPMKALALDIIYEEDCYEAGFETGPVSIAPAVDKIFAQFDYLILDFYNTKDQYIVEEVIQNYGDTYKYNTVLPIGTYTLMDVQFESPSTNMYFNLSPETFEVTKDGVKGVKDNVVWVNVCYQQYETVQVNNKIIINDGQDFSGHVNVSYYDKTDTVSPKNPDMKMIELSHVSSVDSSEIDTKISAGEVCISNVNAYDEDKNPLSVYYQPDYFELTRKMAYTDNFYQEHNIYVFSEESELSEEVLNKVKNPENGYVLKDAKDMNAYDEIKNETFLVYEGNAEFHTIYPGDIPRGEPGYVEVKPSEQEKIVQEVETIEKKEENKIVYLIVIVIVLSGVIGIIFYKKRH